MPSIDVASANHKARHATGGPDAITPADIGAVPADRFRTGTGSPEGVVAAPVGTVYDDLAGTNGAWRWRKVTGAGNTGWRAVDGDTGFRNITSLLVNGWTASSVHIARTPYQVMLLVEGLSAANATNGTALSGLPQGWALGVSRSSLHTTSSTFRRCFLSSELVVSNYVPGDVLYGTVVAQAATTWPTSLVGT